MKEKITTHIAQLFADAPENRQVNDLREELLANSLSKYDDLIDQGISSEEAYRNVISGIGDISGLLSQLRAQKIMDPILIEKSRIRSAVLVSIAVLLFIISPLAVIVFDGSKLGLVIFFFAIALGVSLLIFNSMTKLRYIKDEESFVEEFREWQVENRQKKSVRSAISAILWPLIVVAYFFISFFFGQWHISWLIFIIGVCLEGVISLIFQLRMGDRK
ncbi:MAG: permease prefix domain 1-containing protein [Eubacteriales bacterium]|nr:permease prefix domain 1-containing protein [Eubacteriales bacterium]MDD3197472.1 permease prefix domain 1-containing protein [Eubacteriales bacterium]MDD3503984.1 permease prefix domain 1-containing protein [Eubacteriales bacterium]MDD4682575.1 permease prefix domain 1-containing protein [Eubacteriales bacterium]